jgi:transposase
MDKAFLQGCLAEGLSLEAIGERVGKHPSTVSYWLKKHDLSASRSRRHAPKGPLARSDLAELVDAGLTLREIADGLDRSPTTIRYWLREHDLHLRRGRRSRDPEELRREVFKCARHGETTFVLEGRGYYRCAACRAERVGGWRRAVKRTLVEEAGGKCVICGYSRCQQGLQFHHLDPATKEFHLGMSGITRSLSRSRREARKCVLLCANCHAEVEAGVTELPPKLGLPLNSTGAIRSEVAHSD